MNYAETVSSNPPRMVVMFRRAQDGAEQYEWGVIGSMPILTLIGYIGRIQTELVNGGWIPECDNPVPALVIAFDGRELSHFVHPDIPTDSLAGMLEVIKSMLVGSRMGQHAGAQRATILGPDGKPMRA